LEIIKIVLQLTRLFADKIALSHTNLGYNKDIMTKNFLKKKPYEIF